MAAKPKPAAQAPEERDPFAPVAEGVLGEDSDHPGLRWHDIKVFGVVYRLREYTTLEEDEAIDASENPDGETYNVRLQRRMLLQTSIVSPKTDIDAIASWPSLKTRMLLVAMDRLNNLPPADSQGNA